MAHSLGVLGLMVGIGVGATALVLAARRLRYTSGDPGAVERQRRSFRLALLIMWGMIAVATVVLMVAT